MRTDQSIINRYTVTAGVLSYSVTFPLYERSDVAVYLGRHDGSESLLVLDADYSVSINDNQTGGTVTLKSGVAQAGSIIAFLSNVPYTQELDLSNVSTLDVGAVEGQLDRTTQQVQQLKEQVERSVIVPPTSSVKTEDLVRDLFHARAEAVAAADEARQAEQDVKAWPGRAEVLATGSTTPRTLYDRFADVVNVKDFGAKGDGVTDDTDAFEAAAQSGKAVFVPEGSYNVSRNVSGRFFSLGGAQSRVTITEIPKQDMYISPSEILFSPLDVGGDIPSIYPDDDQRWERALQSPCVDPYEPVLYIGMSKTTGETRMSALTWGETTEKRTLLAHSNYAFNNFSHASNFIYRPTAKDEPLFFCGGRDYSIAGGALYGVTTARLVRWDWRNPGNIEDVLVIEGFASGELLSSTNPVWCLSYDQKKVLAHYRASDDTPRVRVWDAFTFFHAADVATSFDADWEVSPVAGAGQGIYSDGRFVYFLAGSEQTFIHVFDLEGHYLFNRPTQKLGRKAYKDAYNVTSEPEGIFWAPYYGRTEMFLGVSLAVFSDADNWIRRNRYLALSIAEDSIPLGCFTTSTSVTSLDDAIYPGMYTFESDAINAPCGNGYVLVYRHNNDTWATVQIAFERGHNAAIYIRTRFASGEFTEWSALINVNEDQTITQNKTFTRGIRFVDSATAEAMPRLTTQLLGYNKGDVPSANYESGVYWVDQNGSSSAYRIAFERCRVVKSTGMVSLQLWANAGAGDCYLELRSFPTGEAYIMSKASIYPLSDATYSLGSASNRWEQLYAATSIINTSDAREKTSLADPNEALMRAWSKVNFKSFQFIDAMKKKGEDARIHVGVVAQQVAEAFASEGLDASRYALFCYDKWEDEYEDVEVVDVEAVLDEQGNEIEPAVTHTEKRLVTPAGDRYGIRYSEALALECAYQRWRLDKLEARLYK